MTSKESFISFISVINELIDNPGHLDLRKFVIHEKEYIAYHVRYRICVAFCGMLKDEDLHYERWNQSSH